MSTITKNNVIIPAMEYDYLKDIEKARKEVKKKQYLSQDVLFKKMGL